MCDSDLEEPRRVVGAVLDGPGAHPTHSARPHLGIIAIGAGVSLNRVGEVLELVELSADADRRIGGFLLGMRQRLGPAAAMLADPRVLVLDEPANGLDPPGMVWMRSVLRGLADEGRAVLVSSHLLAELAEVVDRVVIIDRGRLVADSTLAELLAGRATTVELRCANPSAVVEVLRRAGGVVDDRDGLLTVTGLSSREVGGAVAAVEAGPIYRLAERTGSFEDA
jgi:ABC-2 type transport system ATP-binding protein